MKLIILLYLEEDETRVERLLEANGVQTWSQMPLEGHGKGAAGWYGTVAPYASHLTFTVVEDERAGEVMGAVAALGNVSDSLHPVHALQLPVDGWVRSGPPAAQA